MLVYLSFVLMSFMPSSETFVLTVKITSIQNNKGVIELSVYNDANKFPQVGKTFKTVRLKPNGSELVHKFTNLPKGEYALCLYHDENSNKTCDRNFIGIPTEAYAFSNNVRPKLSAPDFKSCSTLLSKNKTITIQMVY
jgi:uncharacterized protein (DUF2141 family)